MRKDPALFLGKYRVLRRLTDGPYSDTFLVHSGDPETRAEVGPSAGDRAILKRLKPDCSREYRQLFNREFVIQNRLHVAGVPRCIERVQGPETFFVQEYKTGITLRALLRSRHRLRQRLPIEFSVRVVEKLLRIVGDVHLATQEGRPLGIVHRDISPSNIIVTRDADVALIDFGIAKANFSPMEEVGTIKGKWSYMSPEQLLGLPVDSRADIFACGAVFFEMLTGSRFRKCQTEHEAVESALQDMSLLPSWINRSVHPLLDSVVEAATHIPLDKRASSARTLSLLLSGMRKNVAAKAPKRTMRSQSPANVGSHKVTQSAKQTSGGRAGLLESKKS